MKNLSIMFQNTKSPPKCGYGFVSFCYYSTTLGMCMAASVPVETNLQEHLLNLHKWPVRPVENYNDRLDVFFRFNLIRVSELSLKDQTIKLNVQIYQEWTDYKFKWNPKNYSDINQTSLPSKKLWLPEIALYTPHIDFDLDGKNALVYSSGLVIWQPVATIKSYCSIQVQHYPFDIQSCKLSFASWAIDGHQLWLTLLDLPESEKYTGNSTIAIGMNLQDYDRSTEWQLISIPVKYYKKYYNETPGDSFPTFEFTITIRRHFKLYLVNLVLPLMGLSYLCLIVFYLSAESGEKIVLCVSLLTSQIMFLLLMIDNIPVTSLAVPLLGKIIIFNMLILFFSILCTVIVLNIHHRRPSSHTIPDWVKHLKFCSKFLYTIRIKPNDDTYGRISKIGPMISGRSQIEISQICSVCLSEISSNAGKCPRKMSKAIENICFIQDRMAMQIEKEREMEAWKFLAVVVDRIFFILFHITYLVGMALILMDAPSLYDKTKSVEDALYFC